MKKTELKEIRSKNLIDLKNKIQQLRTELVQLMIEKSLGKLKDVHKSRSKRKDIAQILTFLTQKNYEAAKLKPDEHRDLKGKQNA